MFMYVFMLIEIYTLAELYTSIYPLIYIHIKEKKNEALDHLVWKEYGTKLYSVRLRLARIKNATNSTTISDSHITNKTNNEG